ncbi:MAG: ATP-binding protein [Gammaproteobacteria bacterium]|nr:ATP-binding protein [Gammaproteobacteria bacterium]
MNSATHELRYVSLTCAVMAAVISLVVMIGWVTGYLMLAKFGSYYKPEPMIAAVNVFILSMGLLFYLYKTANSTFNLIIKIMACFVILIATITLLDDLTGVHLHADQWFTLPSAANLKGQGESRVSPVVAIIVFLFGFALILLTSKTENKHKAKSIAAWLGFVIFVIACTMLTGYLYNAPFFIYTGGGQLTTIALPAAISLLLLSIALMTAIGEEYLPLRAFIGPSLFAKLMRGLVPLVIILIIFQGWMGVTHFSKIFVESPLTVAILAIISAILVSLFVSEITLKISVESDSLQLELMNALSYNRALIEASLDPLVTINKDGKITDVNKATEVATGVQREKLIGNSFSQYFIQPELAEKGYKEVFEKGFVKDYPLTLQHVSGSKNDVLYNAVVYKDSRGQIAGVFAAARDVTERNKAETLAKQYAHDLERSNKELQQFAYIASHDLQEPLRVITSYLQLIERRYKDKLDQDANDFITFAVDAAARLQIMIEDILIYSRVETKGNPFVSTDVTTVVKQAIENLTLAIEESHAVITYDTLPTLMADESQLVIFFQNLLGNAIKFRKPDVRPEIHISAEKKEGMWLFSVRDNGIGIDLKYKDKLFIIFKRLAGKEYAGSGIGLAVCKRIVERHKGTIWVDSELGKGSTFYFTLPQ